jgi:hypothetical protein
VLRPAGRPAAAFLSPLRVGLRRPSFDSLRQGAAVLSSAFRQQKEGVAKFILQHPLKSCLRAFPVFYGFSAIKAASSGAQIMASRPGDCYKAFYFFWP